MPIPLHIKYRRKRCQVEMMIDRGYNVTHEELVAVSSEKEFKKYYKTIDNLDKIYVKKVGGEKLYTAVIYHINEEGTRSISGRDVTFTKINEIYDEGRGTNHFILIYNVDLNADLIKLLAKFRTEKFDYNFFRLNPTRHKKSQKIRILSDQEKEEFYNITSYEPREMPGNPRADPVVKYYGGGAKDLLFIERDTILPLSIDEAYYYREIRDIPIYYSGGGGTEDADDAEDEDLIHDDDDGNVIAADYDEVADVVDGV